MLFMQPVRTHTLTNILLKQKLILGKVQGVAYILLFNSESASRDN